MFDLEDSPAHHWNSNSAFVTALVDNHEDSALPPGSPSSGSAHVANAMMHHFADLSPKSDIGPATLASLLDHDTDYFTFASAPQAHSGTSQTMAVTATTFQPGAFVIDPLHLQASANEIAVAIKNGYGAGSALNLLETASAEAHVSFDKMLVLTEAKLETMTGTRVVNAEHRFETTMAGRLADGSAAEDLARLIKHAHISPLDAANVIVSEATEATPGAANVAHALALLLDKMETLKVAEAKIEKIAHANATLILTGLEKQIALGGTHAPTGKDLAAAAEVLEGGLVHVSPALAAKAALADIRNQFSHLDDTAKERSALDKIETLALKEAVAEGQITETESGLWNAGFHPRAAAPAPDATAKAVYDIALQLAHHQLTEAQASAALQQLAQSLWQPGTVPPLPDDVLLAAAKHVMNDNTAVAMAKLTRAGFYEGTVGASMLDPILTRIFKEVSTASFATPIDAKALTTVSAIGLGFIVFGETKPVITEAEARAAFRNGAALAGTGVDAWLMSAINALTAGPVSGRAAIGGYEGNIKTYLAIADIMADRINSGEFAADTARLVNQGKMAPSKAVDFVVEFAELAMDNAGRGQNTDLSFVPSLVQGDGINDQDRAGLALAQFVHHVNRAQADAVHARIVHAHVDTYLIGLGEYSLVYGGTAVTQSVSDAADIIMETAKSTINGMVGSQDPNQLDGSTKLAIHDYAQQHIDEQNAFFTRGLDAIAGAAAAVLDHAGVPLYGASSIGAIAAFVADPQDTKLLVDIGTTLATDFLPDNPFGAAAAIGNVVDILLNDVGLSRILGPFITDIAEGTIGAISALNDGVEAALQGAATVAVDVVVGGSKAIFDVAKNVGGVVVGIFTGDFGGILSSAEDLSRELADDVVSIANDIVDAVNSAVNAIVDAANAVAEAANAIVDAALDAVQAVGEGMTAFIGWLFDLF